MSESTCKSCGADLLWAVSEKGKPIPLNAEPGPDGNIRMTWRAGSRRPPMAEVMPKARLEELKATLEEQGFGEVPSLYTAHFATCPNAKGHRRGK